MLQQQLQQRDEDLAARTAEISDLKQRVAELESLKQQQDQLLTMKDSELAAAQQRLADARKASTVLAPTQPAAVVATQAVQQTPPATEAQPQAGNLMPWFWGGLAVVGLGLLAWLLSRRRHPPAAPRPRRNFDSEALAASMRGPVATAAVVPESGSGPASAEREADEVVPPGMTNEDVEPVIEVTGLPTTPAAPIEAPTWHSGRWVNIGPVSETTTPATGTPRFVPPGDALPPESLPDAFTEPLPEPASAEQRMKLAHAFLDIGDDHSARQLLVELLDGADPAMRTNAAKLLRELG